MLFYSLFLRLFLLLFYLLLFIVVCCCSHFGVFYIVFVGCLGSYIVLFFLLSSLLLCLL